MIKFYKYQGAGNDFIVIDNRKKSFDIKNKKTIQKLCDRHFGIGADGMLILENEKGYDFKMHYINSDGSIGAMCGNGGRCIVHFAHYELKIIKNPKKIKFRAVDGEHEAEILKNGVRLKMQDINGLIKRNGLPFIYCGTAPHNIVFVKNLEKFPIYEEGRKIRYSDPDGTNVNFVEIKNGVVYMRTYERGIENETLACGTGATSVAIACHSLEKIKSNICNIKMPGGNLKIEFEKNKEGKYENIWLSGPAKCVFIGDID